MRRASRSSWLRRTQRPRRRSRGGRVDQFGGERQCDPAPRSSSGCRGASREQGEQGPDPLAAGAQQHRRRGGQLARARVRGGEKGTLEVAETLCRSGSRQELRRGGPRRGACRRVDEIDEPWRMERHAEYRLQGNELSKPFERTNG